MPTVSVYLTDTDYIKYMELKANGKGEWTMLVHKALQNAENIVPEVVPKKIIKTKQDAAEAITYQKKGSWGA